MKKQQIIPPSFRPKFLRENTFIAKLLHQHQVLRLTTQRIWPFYIDDGAAHKMHPFPGLIAKEGQREIYAFVEENHQLRWNLSISCGVSGGSRTFNVGDEGIQNRGRRLRSRRRGTNTCSRVQAPRGTHTCGSCRRGG